MLFNSFEFVAFLCVVLALYWSLTSRLKTWFLLLASYFFYASWDYRFLSLIALSTVVDFWAARAIHRSKDPARRRLFLLASLTTNLGMLGFFKYFDFFLENLIVLLGKLGWSPELSTLGIILPVGISFYTFQTLSYTIDVYRSDVEPSDDFVAFATFVAFFPQLVAGPIERFGRLFPQLARPSGPKLHYLRMGLFLVLQGYLKKVVIADNIAPVVDEVFQSPAAYNAGELCEAAILFAAQIYCDFSGYTDIARGVAYFLGVELVANFRAPFCSRSITEFWRRWHISLSQWLRDYLYIPLGGNRRGAARTYANLMTTMLLGGLWHGAAWTFLAWGAIHGFLLAFERLLGLATTDTPPSASWRSVPFQLVRWLITFALVVAAFVFFRADSIGDACSILASILTGAGFSSLLTLRLAYVMLGILALDLPVLLTERQAWILDSPLTLRLAAYSLFLLLILILSGQNNESFIYFAF
jgi:alginate O-acetyltransferase complex protein AlgI